MRSIQLENWVLSIIDRARLIHNIEDNRIELKAEWPSEPNKAARRIAGHANAARGDSILWIIGIDEKTGTVVGTDYQKIDTWWQQIQKEFDELAPSLTHINVPVEGKTVVALLFETDRAPFVIKNSVGGHHIAREVPWREGTTIRSARRSDLIKMLLPIQNLPQVEVIKGEISFRNQAGSSLSELRLYLELYLDVSADTKIVIPFHRTVVQVDIDKVPDSIIMKNILIQPRETRLTETSRSKFASLTMNSTDDEVIIGGPGRLFLRADASVDIFTWKNPGEASVKVYAMPSASERPLIFTCQLPYITTEPNHAHQWRIENKSDGLLITRNLFL